MQGTRVNGIENQRQALRTAVDTWTERLTGLGHEQLEEGRAWVRGLGIEHPTQELCLAMAGASPRRRSASSSFQLDVDVRVEARVRRELARRDQPLVA